MNRLSEGPSKKKCTIRFLKYGLLLSGCCRDGADGLLRFALALIMLIDCESERCRLVASRRFILRGLLRYELRSD
ncbi:MAG: hypothetical protein QG632_791 [Candidatus Dependentiae bacterium]|nr:hypothetical protein [Candidatus Dependentiae bacterium]